jgi:Carboxypeptidase regulatory-like domain
VILRVFKNGQSRYPTGSGDFFVKFVLTARIDDNLSMKGLMEGLTLLEHMLKTPLMRKGKLLVLLAGMLAFAFFARASDGKSNPCLLQGYVKDAITKRPISGVVVSASVPGANSPKEAVTDADGFFYFSELPSVQINLQFGKKGYQPCKRAGVVIKDKTTVKINIDFVREDINTDPESNTDNSEYPLLRMLDI